MKNFPFLLLLALALTASMCEDDEHPIEPVVDTPNWILCDSVSNGWIERIFFIDETTGFAVHQRGGTMWANEMLVTRNGGYSWYEEYISCTQNGMRDVFFLPGGKGWACGEGGTIIKSTDYGRTWTLLNSGVNSILCAIYFQDELKGWAAGDNSVKLLTIDGGASWVKLNPENWQGNYKRIKMVASNTGYFMGWYGKAVVDYTNDGANFYVRTPPQGSGPFEDMHFIGNTGWLVGNSGDIAKTTDEGMSWIMLASGKMFPYLYGVHFIDKNKGWAVGDSGTIIKTTNGGNTWEKQTVNSHIDMNLQRMVSVQFKREDLGWAASRKYLFKYAVKK